MNRYILIRRLRGPAFLLLVGLIALLNQADILTWSHAWPLFPILLGVLLLAERATLAAAPPADFPVDPYAGAYSGQPYGVGQPYAGQPYAGQPYAGQPYAGQPYAGQPYAGQPYAGPASGTEPFAAGQSSPTAQPGTSIVPARTEDIEPRGGRE